MKTFATGYSGRGVKLTTHLHLVPRLRMRGTITPFSQYVLVAWYLIKQRINLHEGKIYRKVNVKSFPFENIERRNKSFQ
jgi:hypothetical protein